MKTAVRMIPWLIALLIFAFLLHRYPLEQVKSALLLAKPERFIPFLVLYFVYFTIADCWSFRKVLTRFGLNIQLMSLLKIRLASNLAMVVNYGAGQSYFAYLLSTFCKTTLAHSGGIILFQVSVDLFIALSIACAASLFTNIIIDGVDLAPWILYTWLLTTVSYAFLVGLLKLQKLKYQFKWTPVADLLGTLNSLTLSDFVSTVIWRMPLHLVSSMYLFFLAWSFGVGIPLDKVIALLPLTIVIGAIPITPSGLGTVQITSIYLFKNFVYLGPLEAEGISAAEVIFAMSISFTFGIYLLKLVSGAIFSRAARLPASSADSRLDGRS